MATVYLNGKFTALEDASISVLDRGFLFGDGIYEVIPVYAGTPFRFEHHLDRLKNSLREIKIEDPLTAKQWLELTTELIDKNSPESGYQESDQSIYLQITRGVAPRDHIFPIQIKPTIFMMSTPLIGSPAEVICNGISAITEVDSRWSRCNIKSINLFANVLHRQSAIEQDAKEAILIKDGVVTEGAASNLFIVKDGTLITPPQSAYLLPGVTRDLVLELARKENIMADESEIKRELLTAADEIFVTSSTKEIVPVTKLNGNLVGDGSVGTVTKKLHLTLQTFKQNLRRE